jgi:arylsulfatase A-like enzyme
MVSLMTGRSVVDELHALPTQPRVLGEVVQQAGLETAAFVANQGLGVASGFTRGYDVFELLENVRAEEIAAKFVGWHTRREAGKRWFAWVHFIDPHEPYEPDEAHDIFHEPRLDRARIDAQLRGAEAEAEKLSPDPRTQSLADSLERANADSNHYDGEVRSVDDGVGRVLDELQRSGELADTLVIFCADHGDMLYEHRQQPVITQGSLKANGYLPQGVLELFGHGHRPWYYEPLWNTPLLVAGPGMPAGAVRTSLSANLEIFPTVLAALGLPPRHGLEGKSLWGGPEADRERVFAHGHKVSAVIERGGLKLMLQAPSLFLAPATDPEKPELYDLVSDPGEEHDLAATRELDRDRLVREIQAWRLRSPHYGAATADEAQLRILKQFGYVDEDR